MAKVNGVPGFTNFKKVNILDTFLILGNPIGETVATEDLTISGNWTFDNDVGFSGAVQFEDESGTFQNTLFYDIATTPDTIVLTNPITNGDIDLRTNGTGSVLVNGTSPFFDTANNYTVTGDWDFQGQVDMIELDLTGSMTGISIDLTRAAGNNYLTMIQSDGSLYRMNLLQTSSSFQFLPGDNLGVFTGSDLAYNGDNDNWEIGGSGLRIRSTPTIELENLAQTGYIRALNIGAGDQVQVGIGTNTTDILGSTVTINGSEPLFTFELDNNTFLTGADTGATQRNLIGVNLSDVTTVGNATLDTNIVGANVTVNGVPFDNIGVLDNNTYLQGRNNADTLDLDIIAIDTSDNIRIGSQNTSIIANADDGFFQVYADSGSTASADGGVRVVNDVGSNSLGGFFGVRGPLTNGTLRIENFNSTQPINFYHGGEGAGGDLHMSLTATFGRCWHGTQLGDPAWETRDYTATSNSSSLVILNPDGLQRSVGFNQVEIQNETTGTISIFETTDINDYYICDGSGALTLNLTEPGFDEHGQMVQVVNDGSGGANTVTIGENTLTLNWFDGSSVSTGDRTLAVGGIATIVRVADNVFHIFGSGIT